MENGRELFARIRDVILEKYLAEAEELSNTTTNDENPNLRTSVEEITEVCASYGRVAVILDGVFSKVNTPRGKVTDQVVSDLEELLYVGMGEWKRMGQSATPKWHMLLDHVPGLLRRTGGFVDMGEDAIERSRQRRVRDEARLIRLRNDSAIKLSQAKFQNTRMIQEVMDIKQQVHHNSKRKFKKEKNSG